MIASFRYDGRSGIVNGLDRTHVALATNTLREATFFRGTLGHPVAFREALATLYHVVVSDFKYRPRNRPEFQAWLEEQDRAFLAGLGTKEATELLIDRLNKTKSNHDFLGMVNKSKDND